MRNICYVFGAGEYSGESVQISSDAICIAVDGGLERVEALGIVPDVILGDFDSLGRVPVGEKVVKYAKEKDDTDMALALKYGEQCGCDEFHIYGGTGGREDHTIANFQLLARLSRTGRRGYIYGRGFVATAVTDGFVMFGDQCTGTISVFSHGDTAFGVCERGLKYVLDDAILTNDNPLGVSNEFCGKRSRVSVEKGTLIIIMYR